MEDLRLHTSRCAKLFLKNKTREKSIEILRKVTIFKIELTIPMLCVIHGRFCSISQHISKGFFAYLDLSW
jgi:hypothetical protein